VFQPADGSVPTATLGYAGQVGCVQAFNRKKLVLEVNVAEGFSQENNQIHPERITIPLLLTQMAFDSANLEQLEAAVQTMRSNFPLLCTIADTKQAWTYEMGTRDVVRRATDALCLNTATNYISDPGWGKLPDGDFRQRSLHKFANESKGKLDAATVKQYLERTFNQGGVTATAGMKIATLYQFVYEPDLQQLSIRTPYGHLPQWTDVNLKEIFEHQE
jgi:hypothetical protein